jgi:hypothetical protein
MLVIPVLRDQAARLANVLARLTVTEYASVE